MVVLVGTDLAIGGIKLFFHGPVPDPRVMLGKKVLEIDRFISLPKPVRASEIRDARIGADACACENN